jgi:hypothetical protein
MAMPTGARRIRGRLDLRLAVVGRGTEETVLLSLENELASPINRAPEVTRFAELSSS